MTQGARIDLRVDGERVAWTLTGFRGFTPRGRRLAEQLGQIVRLEDRPSHEPSATAWVEARLRELDLPALELELVRYGVDEGYTPQGAEA